MWLANTYKINDKVIKLSISIKKGNIVWQLEIFLRLNCKVFFLYVTSVSHKFGLYHILLYLLTKWSVINFFETSFIVGDLLHPFKKIHHTEKNKHYCKTIRKEFSKASISSKLILRWETCQNIFNFAKQCNI